MYGGTAHMSPPQTYKSRIHIRNRICQPAMIYQLLPHFMWFTTSETLHNINGKLTVE